MTDRTENALVKFDGVRPMDIVLPTEDIPEIGEVQQRMLEAVGATLRAYLNAAGELLQGSCAHLRDFVPGYLSTPGNVLASCCPDGVAIRFEEGIGESRVIAAWSDQPLVELVPMMSQNLIRCHTDRASAASAPATGMLLTLFSEGPDATSRTDIASIRLCFDAIIERPERLPSAPQKPFCLLSVRNALEINVVLQPKDSPGERVILRTPVRAPVGWGCIEVYPFFDVEQWKPEYALVWAERDILGYVVTYQLTEGHYSSLDPNAGARQNFGALLKAYKDLLDSEPEREEILQRFLHDHPALLCPAHVKMWPKLALGARKTDFVFQEATGDYLLVELERSTYRLFLQGGDPSRELDHARSQIIDWKRYLEDNLSTVQREVGLTSISTNPKSLIVIGRTKSLTLENRRKLVAIENESPRLKIMTYDDVYDNAKAVIENLLGPILEVSGNTQVYYLPAGRF